MLLKSPLLAAAGLAVAARAFLLPPEVSESDIKTVNALPVGAFVVPDYKAINLTCPGCPLTFRGRHGSVKVKTDKPSHLELAFAIDHELGHDRLIVNDFELYPSSDPFHNVLSASLVPDRSGKKHKKYRKYHVSHPVQLGFSLQVHPVAQNMEDNLQLIDLNLQIIEIGSTFVNGIPNIHITLVKDSNGKLALGNIQTTESLTSAPEGSDNKEECTTLLCKWMAILKDKLAHMKSGKHCGGMMKGGKVGADEKPHHGHHEDHHGHHPDARPDEMEHWRHHHGWALLFKNIAAHILLPVAIGIIAGITVSLVGMAVGTLIVAVFRTFFRRPSRRQAGRSACKATPSEPAAAEEKSELMDNQEAPPSYEEGDSNKSQV